MDITKIKTEKMHTQKCLTFEDKLKLKIILTK